MARTYDQSTNEILHLVFTQSQIFILSRELCEIECDLLLVEGALREIGLCQRAGRVVRYVGSAPLVCPLVAKFLHARTMPISVMIHLSGCGYLTP